MHIEYKEAPVSGVTVNDEGRGIVTALVSVTGIKDRVNDIIEPGAYARSLKERRPKGVWHHSWTEPVARTLEVEELMPGHKDLPSELPDGTPWPREAGALKVKMQFNLNTKRGRDAYEDVKFFEGEQEWSIGYNVPAGGGKKDTRTGIRHIRDIDLFEYSPVLFGAMPSARTVGGVKDAQLSFKSLMGEDVSDWEERIAEFKDAIGEGPAMDEAAGADFQGDDFEDEEIDFEEEEIEPAKSLLGPLRTAIKSLQELEAAIADEDEAKELDIATSPSAYIEAKATLYESLMEAAEGPDVALKNDTVQSLVNTAALFDAAIRHNRGIKEAAENMMDALEAASEKADRELDGDTAADVKDDLQVIARAMADILEGPGSVSEDAVKVNHAGIEYKMAKGSRTYGFPFTEEKTTGRSRAFAFVKSLSDEDLSELNDYLSCRQFKSTVMQIIVDRVMDERSAESKGSETKNEAVASLAELKNLGIEVDVETK